MQRKTIVRIIKTKLEDWLSTISDTKLREDVKNNLLVSGGSITCLFQDIPVNDYDIYIKDMNVLISLAKYYCSPELVLDGRLKQQHLDNYKKYDEHYTLEDDDSEIAVRLKTLKEDQVKLNISSVGVKTPKEVLAKYTEEGKKYQVAFLSQNAISLTDDIQIVLRFHGDAEQIHKTFDFIHATNYFTFKDGLVTNIAALECILTKNLKYQGSLYPLTSIIRMKKFLKRGWNINAGEMLKIMFQISELDLTDIEVLEEQLIGVDVAYFAKLIDVLRTVPKEKTVSTYIAEIIDRVFNDYEEENTEE